MDGHANEQGLGHRVCPMMPEHRHNNIAGICNQKSPSGNRGQRVVPLERLMPAYVLRGNLSEKSRRNKLLFSTSQSIVARL